MAKKQNYKHRFSLRVGEITHINGVPCEYLGMGNFGTNTYPGRPVTTQDKTHKVIGNGPPQRWRIFFHRVKVFLFSWWWSRKPK